MEPDRVLTRPFVDSEGDLAIGNNSVFVSANNAFIGAMDELAIYGTALSAARVQAHYRKGTGL